MEDGAEKETNMEEKQSLCGPFMVSPEDLHGWRLALCSLVRFFKKEKSAKCQIIVLLIRNGERPVWSHLLLPWSPENRGIVWVELNAQQS